MFCNYTAIAYTISGTVKDEKGKVIPFASVFVSGTTIGTSCNEEGLYTLNLSNGNYSITVKSIGYKPETKTIILDQNNATLNFVLKEETVQIKEMIVYADAEDPAYAVIRNAINKRKFYKEQVGAYSCNVYIKGVQKLKDVPRKVMGVKVNIQNSWDKTSGIIYMSESVSKFSFKQPDKIREEMISSLVSGDNQAFSYNQASDMLFNFYENVLDIAGLGNRGFISPISNSAMLTYRYKLLGTFYENGQLINKIQVIPKRKNDPAFAGIIYIMEDSWRIHSTDLYLTKDAQVEYVDTLYINQIFLPVTDDIWMPFTNKFSFSFDFMGFRGGGTYLGINSDYKINPYFPNRYFSNNQMEVKEDANKKDSIYWKENRPVALTYEEERDYRWRDSVAAIKNTKQFKDSVDNERNQLKWTSIITGYNYRNTHEKWGWGINSPGSFLSFNTVQGLCILPIASYYKDYENNKSTTYRGGLGYGFANKTWLGYFMYQNNYNSLKSAQFSINAGSVFEQYKPYAIPPFFNTGYTLLYEENFMKLYQRNYISISNNSEVINGGYLKLNLQYAYRKAAVNHSYYSLLDIKNKEFWSNNPEDKVNDAPAFKEHSLIQLSPEFIYKIKQTYIKYPHYKYMLDNNYPELNLKYTLGYTIEKGNNKYFDFAIFSLKQSLNMKLFGEFNYQLSAGKSLFRKPNYFIDYFHFNEKNIFIASMELTNFLLLDYYTYSTNNYFLQAHGEYNMKGFLFNKIPLIKLLRLQEVLSIHYLNNDHIQNYFEFGIGIQRLFLRLELLAAYSQKTRINSGIKIKVGL